MGKEAREINDSNLGDLSVGCNNGGGGGNFSKVKRLVAKCIGTQKRVFSFFLSALVGF